MANELPEGTVTVLFTDVEGSTDLTTRRGDEAAQGILRAQRELVRQQVEQHIGHEVKSLGDGFMVAFASARRGVSCAVGIQRALEEHNRGQPLDERVQIRIGLNTGEVIHEEADLFGATVNAAARIAARAKGSQILISEAVRVVLGRAKDVELVDRGRFRLKGFPERWRLFEVVWQKEKAAIAAPALMGTIKLLIVDDHAVVRDGLTTMMGRQEDFAVVGEAQNGLEAVERARELRPDVILMDLRMPEMDGVEAMRRIRPEDPNVKFIVLTTFDSDEYIFDAIEAGAKGYLLKDASREDLFKAVRAVHAGESLIQPGVATKVLDRFAQLSRQASKTEVLSPREVEVLQLMAKGTPNKEIAATLSLGESTVKTHIANIFQKLDVNDRTGAVTQALQRKIIML